MSGCGRGRMHRARTRPCWTTSTTRCGRSWSSWPGRMRVTDAELAPTLDAIVRTAVETIGPADYAGLVLVVSKSIEPVVTTGEPVRILDEWQQSQSMGPCVEAAEQQQPVTIRDTRSEQRWDGFGARAAVARRAEHGLPSALRRSGATRHPEPVLGSAERLQPPARKAGRAVRHPRRAGSGRSAAAGAHPHRAELAPAHRPGHRDPDGTPSTDRRSRVRPAGEEPLRTRIASWWPWPNISSKPANCPTGQPSSIGPRRA